jgi:small subunit ribosomal protein S12
MTLSQLFSRYPRRHTKRKNRRRDLGGCPQRRATCLKIFITTPRKPNSAQRKTARVLLSNYRRVTAYIPGMSHNLQKYSSVLVRGGRAKDLPGVRYTTIRGKYDLHRLVLRRKSRSRYGAKLPDGDTIRAPYYKQKV